MNGMNPPPSTSSQTEFDYDADLEFVKELGIIDASEPVIADRILELLRRVVKNPYEPSLVRECCYLNAANDLFGLSIDGNIVYWSVRQIQPSFSQQGLLAITGGKWRARFLMIERGDGR